MRKIFLATSLFALSAGASTAEDNGVLSLTSKVPQSCTVAVSALTVTVPFDGEPSDVSPFTFICNYSGESASITYTSANGGVKRGTGTTATVRPYEIITTIGNDGESTAPLVTSGLTTTELTSVNNGVQFKIKTPGTPVGAGDYTDTLTISITP